MWDFARQQEGTILQHTYVFTNCGDRVLEIKSVQPGCRCTPVGEWTKQVEPGRTGVIPLQFNSTNFSGSVVKMVMVACNDPAAPEVALQIRGSIWKPIDVKPLFAFLHVTADSHSASGGVRILNNEEAPLVLSAPECDNRAFAAEIKTNRAGKDFRLVIKTVPPLSPGRVQGKIRVKTSSTNAPVLTVTAFVFVPPLIAATPSQLVLPLGPLAAASKLSVRLKNNSTNALTLSDATCNAKNVGVELQTVKTGQLYRATLTFPAGFELPQGQQVEFTCKSSHPLCPLVKVPVLRAERSTAPAEPASESRPASPPGSK